MKVMDPPESGQLATTVADLDPDRTEQSVSRAGLKRESRQSTTAGVSTVELGAPVVVGVERQAEPGGVGAEESRQVAEGSGFAADCPSSSASRRCTASTQYALPPGRERAEPSDKQRAWAVARAMARSRGEREPLDARLSRDSIELRSSLKENSPTGRHSPSSSR